MCLGSPAGMVGQWTGEAKGRANYAPDPTWGGCGPSLQGCSHLSGLLEALTVKYEEQEV